MRTGKAPVGLWGILHGCGVTQQELTTNRRASLCCCRGQTTSLPQNAVLGLCTFLCRPLLFCSTILYDQFPVSWSYSGGSQKPKTWDETVWYKWVIINVLYIYRIFQVQTTPSGGKKRVSNTMLFLRWCHFIRWRYNYKMRILLEQSDRLVRL